VSSGARTLPTVVLVGRDAELGRLEAGLAAVSVAQVCGVAGVGKTAVALAFAARWAGPVFHRQVLAGQPMPELEDDLRRALADGRVATITDDRERRARLVTAIDERGALIVLDDVHRIPVAARTALLADAATLVRGKLVVTAREITPLDSEHLLLRLEALGEDAARELWMRLDALYGPADGFEVGFHRARGNPFLLRQAHARPLDEEDPMRSVVRELTPDERAIAGALALSELRLPLAVVESLTGDAIAGRSALRALIVRLLVDLDGARTCAVHDLVREVLIDELAPSERAALHAALATALREASVDPVSRVREVVRHLVAIERWAEAGALIANESAELVRRGAAGTLLRAIDRIPADARGPGVRLLRARTLGRLLDFRRAADELAALVALRVEPRCELELALGQLATQTAAFSVAESALEAAHAMAVTDGQRLRAQTGLAILRTYQGRGDEGRAFLAALEEASTDPVYAGQLGLCYAFICWIDERDADGMAPIRRALDRFSDGAGGFRVRVIAPILFGVMLAQLGRFDESDRELGEAERVIAEGEDLHIQLMLRAARATVAMARDQRLTAVRELAEVLDAFERCGYAVAALWTRVSLGRLQLVLGRRRAGLASLAAVEADARAAGVGAVVAMVERARADDPLAPSFLTDEQVTTGVASIRDVARAALRAALAGDRVAAEVAATEVEHRGHADDHAVDRALVELARAVVAREEPRDATVAHAAQAAAAAGADVDLISALAERLGVRETAAEPSGAVLDLRAGVLRAGRREILLDASPLLRRVLISLTASPGCALDKAALAEVMWDEPYAGDRESALKGNVHRLRRMLDGTGLTLRLTERGYRLEAPAGITIVPED